MKNKFTLTDPPDATPKAPFALHSTTALPPLVVHSLTAPFQFLQSQTFTLPSRPEVAIYRPAVLGSTLTLVTPPKCDSCCTAACDIFGVHSVTVPFWCPR